MTAAKYLRPLLLAAALLLPSQGCMTALALVRPSTLEGSHDLPWYFVTENAAGGVVGYLLESSWKGLFLGLGVGAVVSLADFALYQAVMTSHPAKCPLPAGPPPEKGDSER